MSDITGDRDYHQLKCGHWVPFSKDKCSACDLDEKREQAQAELNKAAIEWANRELRYGNNGGTYGNWADTIRTHAVTLGLAGQ